MPRLRPAGVVDGRRRAFSRTRRRDAAGPAGGTPARRAVESATQMTQRVDAALGDLHRYLQDEIPPSGAADALARLMAQPPEILMQHVGTWSAEQSRIQSRSVGDLLLHALKKVNAPAELGLLDREAMANYLDRVSTIAIRLCPAEERSQLR